ncbi:MAG: hypothetical protein KJT01_01230 [Gemmatimonadetes bacterium]|nr:hypothetical protein [Gemmatimonadota bacterium]
MNPLDPQPPPTPAAGDVWADLIPNLPDILRPYATERRAQGIERYGTPLQADNGRDALADAFQEELDRIAYLRQYNLRMQANLDAAIASTGKRSAAARWHADRVWWSAAQIGRAISDATRTALEIEVVKAGAP